MGDDAWSYEPYFYYDESSDIEYRMAYNRDGGEVNITEHSMEPETTSIIGYEWDYSAGEDWDEDGSPDGDYSHETYSKNDADSSGYDAWSGLVEWGGVSESEGAWKARSFELFLEEMVLPYLPAGGGLVLDNARIHKGAGLRAKVEAAGCSLLYLPPYSPDFNPIELLWSWLKNAVRAQAPRTHRDRVQAIREADRQLPHPHAAAWFQHCGLC